MTKRIVRRSAALIVIVTLALAGCGGGGGDGGGSAAGPAAPSQQSVDAFVAAVDAVIATANADDVEAQSTANAIPTEDETSEPYEVRTN